jgi:hypothetical protein
MIKLGEEFYPPNNTYKKFKNLTGFFENKLK